MINKNFLKTFIKSISSFFSLILFIFNIGYAETASEEYAMFKRAISQVFLWGDNGILTVPTAIPIGRGNLYFGLTAQDSGQVNGKKLYLTTGSVVLGTSDDVELAYTKRTFIWEDLYRTDLQMDTFHIKARVLHFTDSILPQVSVGMNAASLKGNSFEDVSQILFNPYIAITEQIKIKEKFLLGLSGTGEILYNTDATSDAYFSVGGVLGLFNTIYFVVEAQGIGKNNDNPVINAGARLRWKIFNIGVGAFNLKPNENNNKVDYTNSSYLMASFAIEIPFGKILNRR